MPRVLLLCEYATRNGGENSLLSVLPSLQEQGFSFAATLPGDGPLAAALRSLQVPVHPLPVVDSAGNKLAQAERRKALSALLCQLAPDLIHANSLAMGRLSGPVVAELTIPSLSHIRDIVGLSRQAIDDLNRHDRLLAVSAATRSYHAQQGIAAEKLHVVYNGVDVTAFAPRAATGWLHRELQLPADAMLVGTIGQIGLRKGQDLLATAAASLAGRYPRMNYLLIGQRYSDKAEARAFEADLHDRFSTGVLATRARFLGVRADVANLLPELTMLVHPARQEPLGRVLIEAGGCGLPIVATDVGGTREILPPGTAEIVPSADADALANAISRLADDERRRQQLGSAARQRICQDFTVPLAAAAIARHYREVLEAARPARP